jgi:hypothetical protein
MAGLKHGFCQQHKPFNSLLSLHAPRFFEDEAPGQQKLSIN